MQVDPQPSTIATYHRVRNLTVNTFRREKNKFYQSACQGYRMNPYRLWAIINQVTQRKCSGPAHDDPPVAASALADFFASVTAPSTFSSGSLLNNCLWHNV